MTAESTPNPGILDATLALTSDEFVRKYTGKILLDGRGGRSGALLAYRRLFRDGKASIPGFSVPPVVSELREDSPEGEVVKFLTRFDTGGKISEPDRREEALRAGVGTGLGRDVSHRFEHLDAESVVIPMIGSSGRHTHTLCVSSQIGCAMGCTFCETAQMGLVRSLTAGEIVAQWFNATHTLGRRVKNIVFMGMGEPLDNLDHVLQAIAVLMDHNGASVPASNITVSTVGRVDGIRRLAEKIKDHGWHRLGLALSLNAPNDLVRSSIMPINRRWNMHDLQAALLEWPRFAGNKLCIEYVLIPGVNDAPEHAREIAEFLAPFTIHNGGKPRAMLNLIPYNPRRHSPWPAPEEHAVEAFLQRLVDLGVFAKRRRTKGRAMMGACGQLGSEQIRKRRLVTPTISA